MNILQKLHRWLTQRHQPAEVKTELSEPEANLKKAIQLMRDVQRTAKQWDDYYDDTMRWASTDDCHPLPRTDYENRRLAALAQKARDARMAWSAWMGEGRALPHRSEWPEEFAKWAK